MLTDVNCSGGICLTDMFPSQLEHQLFPPFCPLRDTFIFLCHIFYSFLLPPRFKSVCSFSHVLKKRFFSVSGQPLFSSLRKPRLCCALCRSQEMIWSFLKERYGCPLTSETTFFSSTIICQWKHDLIHQTWRLRWECLSQQMPPNCLWTFPTFSMVGVRHFLFFFDRNDTISTFTASCRKVSRSGGQ